jgi:hypothetical protein
LAADHLLQQPAPDRYALHDLVRAYGADRSAEEDRPPERRAAEARLADHYLCTAAAAMDTVYPAERDRRPRILRPAANVPMVTDPTAAWAWLEAQHPDLIALALHAADPLCVKIK